MSDKQVFVPNGETGGDVVLLLAAAEALDLEPNVVKVETGQSEFGHVVPAEVAKKAGLDGEGFADPWDPPEPPEAQDMTPQHEAEKDLADSSQKPAKKAARKRPAKKAAAKKSAAKK